MNPPPRIHEFIYELITAMPIKMTRVPNNVRGVGTWWYMTYAKTLTKTMTDEANTVYARPTGKCSITWDMHANAIVMRQSETTIGIGRVNPSVFFMAVFE